MIYASRHKFNGLDCWIRFMMAAIDDLDDLGLLFCLFGALLTCMFCAVHQNASHKTLNVL